MIKALRLKIWNKYLKRCAYCGKDITYKQLQVDHIKPYWHNEAIHKGSDDEENLNPSCARCNRWKGTMDLETFRSEINKQLGRLKRDSAPYRLALDFLLITENDKSVKFYYELIRNNNKLMGMK